MENENKNKKLKLLIGMLVVLLISLTIFTITLSTNNQRDLDVLKVEKKTIEEDLQTLIANYDKAIEESEIKDNDLIAARERIEILLDSVKDAEANLDLIRRYRAEVGKLKSERDLLFKRADSLQILAMRYETERDSTYMMLDEATKYADSIALQNEALSKIIVKGSSLKISGMKAEGVLIRNNGKIVDTDRARRAQKVRTCFTLNENEIAEAGDKLLFVQVINPKNNVIGEKATVNFEENILTYSATTNVFYENEALDVCVMVDAAESDLVEGNYTINVFEGPRLISTSRMSLK